MRVVPSSRRWKEGRSVFLVASVIEKCRKLREEFIIEIVFSGPFDGENENCHLFA